MGVEPTSIGLQPIALPSGSSVSQKVSLPGVEPDLRPSQSRVLSLTLQGQIIEYPAEEKNLARRLRKPSCIRHTRRATCVSIPTWTRTRAWTFGGSNAIRYTIGT